MSRLLPLLRSRTARSLRPGPAAAPRPPSWCRCGRGLLALAAPGGSRGLGTHPKKEPMEALNTAQGARDFIYSLHSTERSCLLKELHRFESIAIAQGKGASEGRARGARRPHPAPVPGEPPPPRPSAHDPRHPSPRPPGHAPGTSGSGRRRGGYFPSPECPQGRLDRRGSCQAAGTDAWLVPPQPQRLELQPRLSNDSVSIVLWFIACLPSPALLCPPKPLLLFL